MPSVLPSLRDKYRVKRNGKKLWIGQVLLFDGKGPPRVIAEVRDDNLGCMRRRKHAVYKALLAIENDSPSKGGTHDT